MAGRIQAQFDLLSNSSGAEAAVKRYAEQLKAANAVLAQAERTAKESYQSQSLSAKAAGASAEALTKIQQEYFQSLVAIRNAAKDTGAQLVQSNTGAASSENAKTEAIRLATSAIEQQTIAVKANVAAQSSSHSISNQSAASGAVQLLDGRGGIRTVENFLGNTLGLGGVFGALFPVIGAVQAGKLLFDLGEKVYEVGHKATDAGRLLSDAFAESHSKAQVTIDDLTVQADKIQDNIDKLSGHPSNGLKTALDEARAYADKLQLSLQADRKELDALLKEHQIGAFASLLSGVASTVTQDKQISDDHAAVEGKVASANAAFNADSANAKSLDDIKRAGEKRDKAIRDAIQGTINTYKTEGMRLKNEQTQSLKDALVAADGGGTPGNVINNSGKLADIQVAQGRYQDYLNKFNAEGNVAALTERENKLKGDKAAGTLANEATRKAQEAARKAAETQRKQWDDDHAAWEAAGQRSTSDEISFWVNRANQAAIGSENYIEASKKADVAIKKANDERRKLFEENLKMSMEFAAIANKGIMAAVMPGFSANAKGIADAYTSGKALEDTQRQGAYAVAQANIALAAQRGQISANDAAIQTASLHQIEYEEKLADLRAKLGAVQLGPDADAQRNDFNKQIADLSNGRAMQQMQDSAQVAATSISGALQNVNDTWLADTKNTAKEVADLYRSTVEGLNNDLSNALMRVGERGQHHLGRQLGNAVGGTLRSGAGQLANYGLKTAESSLLGSFGLAGKPDGTRSNPWFVQMAGIGALGGNPFTGDLASKLGFGSTGKDSSNSGSFGVLSSVFGGVFGGGKAVGGPVNAGTTYLVGENGPELFNPGASGNIMPNNKLKGMMRTTYLHMPVDARGATNPAEVEAAANRAVSRAAPQIVAASLRAHSDQQNRKPYSQRS